MASRIEAWNSGAARTVRLDLNVRWPIKHLAKIDCELYDRTDRLIKIRENISSASPEDLDFVYDSIGLSYFWILGAYEIVRTLDQRFRSKFPGQASPFSALKRELARVRVPIAKQEPANGFPDDYDYPNATLKLGSGIGWSVNETQVINFADLSDSVLSVLTSFGLPG